MGRFQTLYSTVWDFISGDISDPYALDPLTSYVPRAKGSCSPFLRHWSYNTKEYVYLNLFSSVN